MGLLGRKFGAAARARAERKKPVRKPPRVVQLRRQGVDLCVMRPRDPALAIRLSLAAKGQLDFNSVLRAQEYFFVGLAGHEPGAKGKPYVLHPVTLEVIEEVRPGDSFVDYHVMLENNPNLLDRFKEAETPPTQD